MSSLYDLTEDLVALDRLLEEQGGDVSEGSGGETLEKWLKEYEWQVGTKIDAYGSLAKNWDSDINAIDDEMKRLSDRKRVIANKIMRLKMMAKLAMEMRGIRKLEGQKFTIAIQKNGGKLPLILKVEDPEKLPEKFVKIEKRIDTEAIRSALEIKDPDAANVAELGQAGESVRIR